MSFIPQNTPTPTPTPPPTPILDVILGYIMEFLPLIIGIIVLCIIIYVVYKVVIKKRLTKKRDTLLFTDFNIGKYAVVMFRKIGDRYVEIDRTKLEINAQKFRYNNKDFTTFDVAQIAFSDSRNNYYAFDYDTGKQLTFAGREMPKQLSIEDVDIYVNRNIITQLVAGLEQLKGKGQWMMLIVGAILGVGIGIIIGMYAVPHASETAKMVLTALVK